MLWAKSSTDPGVTKTWCREASGFWSQFILDQHAFIYGTREFCITGGSQNDQIYRKHSMTGTEWMHSFSTYSQETPGYRSQRAFSLFCSFVFTYAEIKSNSDHLYSATNMMCGREFGNGTSRLVFLRVTGMCPPGSWCPSILRIGSSRTDGHNWSCGLLENNLS